MIFNQQKHLSNFVIVFVLMISFVFCCGAAWNTMLSSGDEMSSGHSACGMGDMGSQSTSDHNQFIVSSITSLFKNFTIVLSLALVSVFLVFFKILGLINP